MHKIVDEVNLNRHWSSLNWGGKVISIVKCKAYDKFCDNWWPIHREKDIYQIEKAREKNCWDLKMLNA